MRLMISLFSPATGTLGGLTRALAIARAAQEAGSTVAFCASGSIGLALRQHKFPVYSMPSPTMFGLPGPISRMLASRSQKSTIPIKPGKSFGNIWFVHVFSGMGHFSTLLRMVTSEIEAIKDFQPDKIFTDLDLAAFLSASITGIPITGAFQGVMLEGKGSLFWKVVRRATDAVQHRYRIPTVSPDELTFGKQVLKIIPSIPELEGVNPERPDICYVGQLLGEIQSDRRGEFKPEHGKRYIFAYLGTGALPLATFRKIVPDLLRSEADWGAIVGDGNLSHPERFGPVEFRPYVSAQALLPHCGWTICHGGQNTIMQSLLHGVPLLIFPGPIFERRFNAQKVQACGAGAMGELPDFNTDWLRSKMAHQEKYAIQARHLGDRIREYGGAHQAVQAIANWEGYKEGMTYARA